MIAAIVRTPIPIISSTNRSWQRLRSFRITSRKSFWDTGDSPSPASCNPARICLRRSTLFDFSGNGNGPTAGSTKGPILVGDPYCHPKGRNCWLNPASFAAPARIHVWQPEKQQPVWSRVDPCQYGAIEAIPDRESQQVEFRWEVFNVPNHANLYGPQVGRSRACSSFSRRSASPLPRPRRAWAL